jgi:tetratricopeptide (TPR) repeat protein
LNYAYLWKLLDKDKNKAWKEINLALNDNPEDFRLLALLGKLFQKDDAYGLAFNCWKRVLQLDKHPEAAVFNNIGLAAACVGTQEYQDVAEANFRKALLKDENNVPSLNNLALFSLHAGDHDQCVKLCERSLAIQPDQPEVHETRAYAHLMYGRFEEGWKDWEWSLGSKYRPHIGTEPYWEGQKGIDLLLRGEQGIGDEISFASCLPDVAKECRVTLECDYRLHGLFSRSFPDVKVVGSRIGEKRGVFENHDYRALLGSLARHYRNKPEDFPGTPYLVPDPERRLQWKALLDTLPGKKIGIAWTGGKLNTFRERRSMKLERLLPILRTGHTFVSLEYKNPDDEIADLKAKHGIEVKHWPRATESNDYDDTAALVSELDLVISATTAVVHLCGALGKECLVMAPKKPRWFYQRQGSRIPWYQSVEVFRQGKDWPIAEIAARL